MRRRAFLRAAAAGVLCSSTGAFAAVPQGVGEPRAGAVAQPVRLTGGKLRVLEQTVKRLRRVQKTVGYGNFSLLGFDRMLRFSRNYSAIGEFTPQELAFLEEIFFEDAAQYGFFGTKVLRRLTDNIPPRDIHKVPGSGHYLFKGHSLGFFAKVRKDVGDSLVLTSGIRGIVKQMHLFLSKAVRTEGDLSLAARSLAPPGHSYHGVGDFDVGRKGFGLKNFSAEFASTAEYKRLTDLGYVFIRYPPGNPDGVRFEPWHIRVV